MRRLDVARLFTRTVFVFLTGEPAIFCSDNGNGLLYAPTADALAALLVRVGIEPR